MRIPTARAELEGWVVELARQCMVSRKTRSEQCAVWSNYYLGGSSDPSQPAEYNKIDGHIERLAAILYSPDETRFAINFRAKAANIWKGRAEIIGRELTDEFHASGLDLVLSDAVEWGLVYGAMPVKVGWDGGLVGWMLNPWNFGVYDERRTELWQQEALCQVTYMSMYDLARLVAGNRRARQLLENVDTVAGKRDEDDLMGTLHQVIISGNVPVTQATPSGIKGVVDVFNVAPQAQLAPEVAAKMLLLCELWVKNDATNDYSCIQFVDPSNQVVSDNTSSTDGGILIEGGELLRNTFAPGHHPYGLVRPNPHRDYFWGRSEIANLYRLQDTFSKRFDDINHIWHLRAHPPRAMIGFASLGEDNRRAMTMPDGLMTEAMPTGKIENLAPEMPAEGLQQLEAVIGYFDESGGFPPIMQGRGEGSVRAGSHAETLQRSAAARMRKAALRIERQVAEIGDLCLGLIAAKDPTEYQNEQGESFSFAQIPMERGDYRVNVDSHSSSPAFMGDAQELAFALKKVGAITGDGVLLLTNPPHLETLREQNAAAAKAQQQMLQQHPELLHGKR